MTMSEQQRALVEAHLDRAVAAVTRLAGDLTDAVVDHMETREMRSTSVAMTIATLQAVAEGMVDDTAQVARDPAGWRAFIDGYRTQIRAMLISGHDPAGEPAPSAAHDTVVPLTHMGAEPLSFLALCTGGPLPDGDALAAHAGEVTCPQCRVFVVTTLAPSARPAGMGGEGGAP